MKGAIGNAFILNMVITFMLIFFSLLIGSMAYSKAYKTKNFLINELDKYEQENEFAVPNAFRDEIAAFESNVNPYLSKIGYMLSTKDNSCPSDNNPSAWQSKEYKGYYIVKDTKVGDYEYCIYWGSDYNYSTHQFIKSRHNYMVLVYMKFDFPVIGQFIKIPITGETKTYTYLK